MNNDPTQDTPRDVIDELRRLELPRRQPTTDSCYESTDDTESSPDTVYFEVQKPSGRVVERLAQHLRDLNT